MARREAREVGHPFLEDTRKVIKKAKHFFLLLLSILTAPAIHVTVRSIQFRSQCCHDTAVLVLRGKLLPMPPVSGTMQYLPFCISIHLEKYPQDLFQSPQTAECPSL